MNIGSAACALPLQLDRLSVERGLAETERCAIGERSVRSRSGEGLHGGSVQPVQPSGASHGRLHVSRKEPCSLADEERHRVVRLHVYGPARY